MIIPDIRFEDEIEEFEKLDCAKPPATGGIMFYGDSDIRYWLNENQFEKVFLGFPAVNRGFGGARIWETILYFKRVVIPHNPSVIVYSCGDNDVCELNSLGEDGPYNVEIGFRIFLDLVSQYLPELKQLIYLAIHQAPGRNDKGFWPVQNEANKRVEKICDEFSWVLYADYNYILYGSDGQLKDKYFSDDRVHLSPLFYEKLGNHVKILLDT